MSTKRKMTSMDTETALMSEDQAKVSVPQLFLHVSSSLETKVELHLRCSWVLVFLPFSIVVCLGRQTDQVFRIETNSDAGGTAAHLEVHFRAQSKQPRFIKQRHAHRRIPIRREAHPSVCLGQPCQLQIQPTIISTRTRGDPLLRAQLLRTG